MINFQDNISKFGCILEESCGWPKSQCQFVYGSQGVKAAQKVDSYHLPDQSLSSNCQTIVLNYLLDRDHS